MSILFAYIVLHSSVDTVIIRKRIKERTLPRLQSTVTDIFLTV